MINNMYSKNLLFFFCNLCFIVTLIKGLSDDERKAYIVYMGELPTDGTSVVDQHNNLLLEIIGNEEIAKRSKIHSYGRSFNGFVAKLLPREANKLSLKENVVSVFLNTVQKLRTTRSWDFLGMPETVKRNPKLESNIIVGLLDTGIFVESKSFSDEGYGPPPRKWKGKCDKGVNFTRCNNKVIGAQYFNLGGGATPDQLSPVDFLGHGTHTASTAAGGPVRGASLYGIAEGTARGGVPSARIASYKVCWSGGCYDMDMLAAFDTAIADGVDIISVSIGGDPRPYFQDPMAIGSFHALKKGILVSCAAGNGGNFLSTVENVAPWIMTVAASATDRKLESAVKLGNGKRISGFAINTFKLKKEMYPLLNGALAANANASNFGNASTCDLDTLSAKKVKGNIVYCIGASVDTIISQLGGVGTIMSSDIYTDTPFASETPATTVTLSDGDQIDRYINSTKGPKAIIYKTESVNVSAPFIASFSSMGPQSISLNILKPDIAAPGLSILAAYSELTSMTGDPDDKRIVKYNIDSGTSMACPHAASAAAYVRSFHPYWSPAAIKSALMTTATPMKIKQEGAELLSGSGQIDPTRALHPGLIYDINVESYISFICKEGYNSTEIKLLTGSKKNCSSFQPAKGTDGLNYPSMHIQLTDPNSRISAVFYRTVTYVGQGKAVFQAKVESPKDLSITVTPKALTFNQPYEKKSFKVTLKGKFVEEKSRYLSGSLVWNDTRHIVTSPILVYRPKV